MNWWVSEISDPVHWDTEGLSIIDPRQIQHLLELIDPLRDYGFEPEIFESAFFKFAIDKKVDDENVRLKRVNDSILESEEALFALPDLLDDEKGPYADLLDHVSSLRVKMLNDVIGFEQKLTPDDLEEEIREEQNQDFMEGRAIHSFNELLQILEFVPEGFELDEDEDEEAPKRKNEEDLDGEIPDIGESDENIEEDETMKWDEDEEEDDFEKDEEDSELGDEEEEEGEEEEAERS